ncbi:ABC transporter ATP-binding protein [Acidocella sp. KAb 2-4]|uniref:ABC transporter ATP-binding protein n=1 Tax=Acidocella sp. KAb 2-4 TaxID=2885158 RepID=UPI001D07C78F|nr:ABC transporter ATP-binding protein [Acidocella sp. KAb 2-4]MCB5945583.1 ABC transporter ATP-binding protein [Acidocella sp. KAb 2-4]
MSHSLRLTGASRRLGGRPVLHGIDLALPAGAFLVLAGESGSGKTTMLRMIAGLDRANTGTVEINGRVVDDAARVFIPAERRGLGMVFQDFALWPHLSCRENVALALPAATPKRAEVALALLERMGVAAMAQRRPAELSGGQQQRVGIARALAAKPSLLLLDEPLSALDLETRERLREELRESLRAAGVGAVLVSHDPEDCWKLADQVAVLEQGVIRQAGTPQALWEAPASPYIARFTGAHGGVSVPVADGAVLLGGQPLPHPGARLRGPRARLFWRDDAIRPAAQGIPAEAMDLRFEAGRYCVRWRIAGLTQPLSGYTAAPVPLGAHHLAIDPARIFLFDDSGDN